MNITHFRELNVWRVGMELSKREYIRFLSIASGSVAELQTQLILVQDLGLVGRKHINDPFALAERISQMLYRLRQSLGRGIEDRSRVPGPGSRVPTRQV